jgi:hypothetical protein
MPQPEPKIPPPTPPTPFVIDPRTQSEVHPDVLADYANPTPGAAFSVSAAVGAPTGDGGIPEAPLDGSQYGRQSGQWVVDPIHVEAPLDGQRYARSDSSSFISVGLKAGVAHPFATQGETGKASDEG